MKLLDTVNGHWYEAFDNVLPSVTTILDATTPKPFLTDWMLKQGYKADVSLRNAINTGNVVHDVMMRLLRGEEIDIRNESYYEFDGYNLKLTSEMRKAIESGVVWFEQNPVNILATEIKLAHDKYEFAGTCDIVFQRDDKTYLVDTKTSNQLDENVNLQLTAYKILWDELYPDNKIDKIAVLHCKKAWMHGKDPCAKFTTKKFDKNAWLLAVERFKYMKKKPTYKYNTTRSYKLGMYL
jgi:hypothetical protein